MREVTRFRLTNEDIDQAVGIIRTALNDANQPHRDCIRLCLLMEECLLNLKDHYGEDREFILEQSSLLRRRTLSVKIMADAFNPLNQQEGIEAQLLGALMSVHGLLPVWHYVNGCNVLSLSFRQEKKGSHPVVSMLLSVLLAVVCSGVVRLLPESAQSFIINDFTTPIYNKFLGVIGALAGPLIFFSVLWGIVSIGDLASLNKIGKKMIARFLGMMTLMTLVTLLVFLPFYPLSGTGENGFAFSSLFQMILDIIPENVLQPFIDSNPLQIICIAVILGVGTLILTEQSPVIISFVEQLNRVVQLIMLSVSSLTPAFIFLSIFNLITSGNLYVLADLWRLILSGILSGILVLLIYTVIVSVHQKVSPFLLWKKLLPTALIAITTGSSSAAFATNIETCEHALGIDSKLSSIGVPLGQVIFKCVVCAVCVCAGYYVADAYSVSTGISWLFTLFFSSIVLAAAAPPVPGGAVIIYSVLLEQLGIPAEALVLCITANVILDFTETVVNLSSLQMELVELGSAIGLLDRDTLRKDIKIKNK